MTEEKKHECKNCDLVRKLGFSDERDFLRSFLTQMTEKADETLNDMFKSIEAKLTEAIASEAITGDDAAKIRGLVNASIVEQMIWDAARLAQHSHIGIDAFVGEAAALWVRASPRAEIKLAEALAALLEPIEPKDETSASTANRTIN